MKSLAITNYTSKGFIMKAKELIKGEINRKIYGDKLIANDMKSIIDELERVLNLLNGKKCFKVDGSKTKAFNDVLEPIFAVFKEQSQRVYFNTQYSSLYVHFSYGISWESYEDKYKSDDFSYIEFDFYLGKKDNNGILNVSSDMFQQVHEKCETLLKVCPAEVAKKLGDIKELIIKAKEINDALPYYARLTLPYVG
jgi:hypothetical protein